MPELVITRGLPGSGKTTFAEQWVQESPDTRRRVNRDSLRRMIHVNAQAATQDTENAIVCGTTAGYRQHQRNRTTPCKKCRAAQAAYMRNYRHQNGHNKARLVPDHIIQQHGIKVNT